MKYLLFNLAATILMGTTVLASNISEMPPLITIPKMRQSPAMNGNYDDVAYRYCVAMNGFCGFNKMHIFPAEARYCVGIDGKNLIIAAQTQIGPQGLLARAQRGRGGTMAFLDDSFEFVFSPKPRAKKPIIYHYIVNSLGSYHAAGKKGTATFAWSPKVKINNRIVNGKWVLELNMPLREIGIENLAAGQTLGLRIARNWRRLSPKFGGGWGIQSSWNQHRCEFFSNSYLPNLVYAPNAPVVKFLKLKATPKGSNAEPTVSIYNPTDKTMVLKLHYRHRPAQSQSIARDDTLTLMPGETKVLKHPVAQILDNELISTTFAVFSNDGKTTWYRRSFVWKTGIPKELFASGNPDKNRISMNFAYYPSSDSMFIKVNLRGIKNPNSIKAISAVITDHSGSIIASTKLPKPFKGISEYLWKLPNLKEITQKSNPSGEYQLTVNIDGIKNANISREFERKIFDWEGNQLGKSKIIIPGFEAIKLEENRVSTVLRKHYINKFGLWEQVNANGKKMLKNGGIHLEAVINGKSVKLKPTSFKFTKVEPTKVIAQSGWSADSLKCSSISDFDYDGMMKYTLTLSPSDTTVTSLKLIIPLDNQYTYLMHTVTDSLRIHYGGDTPKGKGTIWQSTKAPRMDLKTDFVPYIWLGTESGGVAVFGENDKSWELNPEVPAQELIRKNGTLLLIYNLIAKPVVIKKTRKIVLGFQATPIKHMPKNWRRMALWNYPPKLAKYLTYPMHFLGSSYTIGGATIAADVHPVHKNTALWEAMGKARENKKIPNDYIDTFLEKSYPKEPKRIPNARNELRYAFRTMTLAPKGALTAYTNARGVRLDTAESRTFLDEWLREEFQESRLHPPAWGTGKSYSLNPTTSYQDFAMKWYKTMLTTKMADAIYWDDIFLATNSARAGSDAYLLENGILQPATGLFEMRELVRRTAILECEMGIKPNNMVHMTNTAIAPILSFAQQNLDWEDNLGVNPFQQRYTKAYIRTLSIGRQFGNLPGVLGLVPRKGNEKKIKWCIRTGTGVMLAHELKWNKGYAASDYYNLLIKLYQFGYGYPETNVYNYWQANYPLKVIKGGDTASLIVSKTGAARIIVSDYGNGGKFNIELDLTQLGLKSGQFTARNGETGTKLAVNTNIISFSLKKYDFIYIEIDPK